MGSEMCIRDSAHAAAGGGGRRRCRTRVRVPYLVQFFLNRVSRVWVTADHTRSAILIRNTTTVDRKPPRTVTMVGRFLSEMSREPLQRLGDFYLKRTIATVQTKPLQPFGRICLSWSAINSAPFLSFQHTSKQSNKTKKRSFFCSEFQQILK